MKTVIQTQQEPNEQPRLTFYAGIRIKDNLVPYIKADDIHYEKGQLMHMAGQNIFSFIASVRYELNYLSVLILEFEYTNTQFTKRANRLALQWSVGF